MSYNPLIGRPRGANVCLANPQRLESKDGKRWACGRNVKGEGKTPGTWVPVEVWTLKARDERGKVAIVDRYCSKKEALAWTGQPLDGLPFEV